MVEFLQILHTSFEHMPTLYGVNDSHLLLRQSTLDSVRVRHYDGTATVIGQASLDQTENSVAAIQIGRSSRWIPEGINGRNDRAHLPSLERVQAKTGAERIGRERMLLSRILCEIESIQQRMGVQVNDI